MPCHGFNPGHGAEAVHMDVQARPLGGNNTHQPRKGTTMPRTITAALVAASIAATGAIAAPTTANAASPEPVGTLKTEKGSSKNVPAVGPWRTIDRDGCVGVQPFRAPLQSYLLISQRSKRHGIDRRVMLAVTGPRVNKRGWIFYPRLLKLEVRHPQTKHWSSRNVVQTVQNETGTKSLLVKNVNPYRPVTARGYVEWWGVTHEGGKPRRVAICRLDAFAKAAVKRK